LLVLTSIRMHIEKYCNISSIMLSDFRALGSWQTPVSLCVCVCVWLQAWNDFLCQTFLCTCFMRNISVDLYLAVSACHEFILINASPLSLRCGCYCYWNNLHTLTSGWSAAPRHQGPNSMGATLLFIYSNRISPTSHSSSRMLRDMSAGGKHWSDALFKSFEWHAGFIRTHSGIGGWWRASSPLQGVLWL